MPCCHLAVHVFIEFVIVLSLVLLVLLFGTGLPVVTVQLMISGHVIFDRFDWLFCRNVWFFIQANS